MAKFMTEFIRDKRAEQRKMSKSNSKNKELFNKDIQTLYEAGYIDSNLEFTEKGKEALFNVLYDAIFETYKPAVIELAKIELTKKKSKK